MSINWICQSSYTNFVLRVLRGVGALARPTYIMLFGKELKTFVNKVVNMSHLHGEGNHKSSEIVG